MVWLRSAHCRTCQNLIKKFLRADLIRLLIHANWAGTYEFYFTWQICDCKAALHTPHFFFFFFERCAYSPLLCCFWLLNVFYIPPKRRLKRAGLQQVELWWWALFVMASSLELPAFFVDFSFSLERESISFCELCDRERAYYFVFVEPFDGKNYPPLAATYCRRTAHGRPLTGRPIFVFMFFRFFSSFFLLLLFSSLFSCSQNVQKLKNICIFQNLLN